MAFVGVNASLQTRHLHPRQFSQPQITRVAGNRRRGHVRDVGVSHLARTDDAVCKATQPRPQNQSHRWMIQRLQRKNSRVEGCGACFLRILFHLKSTFPFESQPAWYGAASNFPPAGLI